MQVVTHSVTRMNAAQQRSGGPHIDHGIPRSRTAPLSKNWVQICSDPWGMSQAGRKGSRKSSHWFSGLAKY